MKFKENDFRILEFTEKYIFFCRGNGFFFWKLNKMILKYLKSRKSSDFFFYKLVKMTFDFIKLINFEVKIFLIFLKLRKVIF